MSTSGKETSYRPDIDGLRAIAVLAVILYHFNPTWLPGGFIGVDIFFVISGYFIIGIIMREMTEGKFSLVDFWERRVRRIFPALFVVLTVTTIASYYFLLIPHDIVSYGQSLMSQSVSISNWWFMRQSPYFAAPDNSIPLLHTWSLSVEEQFYLLFPLLTLLLYPIVKKRFGIVMIGMAILSFAYSVLLVNVTPDNQFTIPLLPHIWGSTRDSSAGFYFIASRFWELMVGGIVALYVVKISHRWMSELIAFSGLSAIGVGFLYITDTSPFPGVAALVPVLCTAAVIVANTNQTTIARKALSFPILVYVGLISYSLYLWHWPLLVFAKYQLIPPAILPAKEVIFLLMVIFIFSVATYHFVENPIRTKRFLIEREHLFLSAFFSMTLLFTAGLVLAKNNGNPDRVPLDARMLAASLGDLNPRTEECFTKSAMSATRDDTPCLLGVRDPSRIDFVLWGDSHANAVMPAFDEFGRRTNRTGIFFGAAACAPLLTDKPITNDPRCIDQLKEAREYIQAHPSAELFIVSEWREAYKYTDYTDRSNRFSLLAPLLSETLTQFPKETKITIFLRIQTNLPQTIRGMFFKLVYGQPSQTVIERKSYEGALEHFNVGIREVASNFPNVRLLNPTDMFCHGDDCFMGDSEGFYYADDSHLSTYGAMQIILPLLLNADKYSQKR